MKTAAVMAVVLTFCITAFATKHSPVSVTITAPVETVRSTAVALASANGYVIEQEGQFQIVFTKDMSGASGFFTNLLLAPPACSSISPRWLLTVMFVPGTDGVTLHAVSQYEHAGPFCQPVRENFDNRKARDEIQAFFDQIRTHAETAATTPLGTGVQPTGPPAAANAPAVSGVNNPQADARKIYLDKVNGELEKESIGYANLEGPDGAVLVVHSIRADSARYNNLLADQDFIGALRIYGFSKFVYTNDHDKTYTWYPSSSAGIPESAVAPSQNAALQQQSVSATAALTETVVDFKSRPTGAAVFVDGKSVGRTPLSLTLTPGEHLIQIVKKDFRTYQETLTITSEHQLINAYLEQLAVHLSK